MIWMLMRSQGDVLRKRTEVFLYFLFLSFFYHYFFYFFSAKYGPLYFWFWLRPRTYLEIGEIQKNTLFERDISGLTFIHRARRKELKRKGDFNASRFRAQSTHASLFIYEGRSSSVPFEQVSHHYMHLHAVSVLLWAKG